MAPSLPKPHPASNPASAMASSVLAMAEEVKESIWSWAGRDASGADSSRKRLWTAKPRNHLHGSFFIIFFCFFPPKHIYLGMCQEYLVAKILHECIKFLF